MTSPNDQDPPDYVTGDTEENAFFETIYEKFPWLMAVEEMLGDDVVFTGEPIEGVHEMLTFVINESVKWGRENERVESGEYLQQLEQEALDAISMVLDAATEEGHELSDSEICNAIDWEQHWEQLRKTEKKWKETWGWSSEGERT